MLSRTADNLFWITRHMERADTSARLLEIGARISQLPSEAGGFRNEWDSLLRASSNQEAFSQKYGAALEGEVERWLFFDRDNPGSVASCLAAARENGRIVRTALTTQVWESLNTSFQQLRALEARPQGDLDFSELIDWTMRMTALTMGSIEATQLRHDSYDFLRLGYALERADSTARLMDVKYYVLLPHSDLVGSGLDHFQWQMLLRALSAHRAFNWAYGGEISAPKIAHFLILNPACPRSLMAATRMAVTHLDGLARRYGHSGPAQRAGRDLLAELEDLTVGDIFEEGLHDFLSRFIRTNAALADAVARAYLSGGLS